MTEQTTIKLYSPGTVTEQVPDAIRYDCLPGFSHSYLSGTFGYVLLQSVRVTGIEMYYLSGKFSTPFSCRISCPEHSLAIAILMEGAVSLQEENGPPFTLRRGSICLISRADKMCLRQTEKGDVSGMLFLYPYELIVSILSFYPRLNDIRTALQQNKQVLSAHDYHTGAVLAEKMHLLTHTPFIPSMEEFYRNTITETAHHVFSALSSDIQEMPVTLHDIACVHKAKQYIDEHLSTHFSIRQIARQAGINQLKLKTGFREVYGTGLYGYLRTQRLTAARTALVETRLTLKEISHRAGYKSLSNFCTAYRKQFGIAPGQARKQKGKV